MRIINITILFFSFLLTGCNYSFGQFLLTERQELQKLLELRKQKFDAYAVSIEKRSGIFGNKTKRDMQLSNDVLTEIVKTDNHIIDVLNNTIDFKNFEKTNLNYNVQTNSDRVNELLHSVDTLQKQVKALNELKAHQRAQINRQNGIVISLLILFLGFLIYRTAKRFSSTSKS